MSKAKTVIVTGASQGIGAEVVRAFLDRGYNIVANSRNISRSGTFKKSSQLQVVDGDIGEFDTATRLADSARDTFGSIDALVNNAGIFFTKPFTEYTQTDFRRLVSTNIQGFIHLTQLSIKQMLKQGTGGSVVSITTSMVDHPIAGVTASIPMITKGGLDAVSRSLAARDRRYATPQGGPAGLPQDALADGNHQRPKGNREGGALLDRITNCDGRSAPR